MSAAGMAAGAERRRRVRRSALLWALIAAWFYVAFIVIAVMRSTK